MRQFAIQYITCILTYMRAHRAHIYTRTSELLRSTSVVIGGTTGKKKGLCVYVYAYVGCTVCVLLIVDDNLTYVRTDG